MKWQNLTNRIYGSIFTISLLANLIPITAASAQKSGGDTPVLLKKCWVSSAEEPADQLFASDNDSRLFLTRAGGKVGAIDNGSGKGVWQSDFGGTVVSNLFGDKDSIFFATNSVSVSTVTKPAVTSLRSISRQTGIVGWTTSLPFSEDIYLGESEGKLFAIGAANGGVSAIVKADGGTAWQSLLNKKLTTAPLFGADSIVFALESGEIVIISPIDGRTLFQIKTESIPVSLYLADGNILIWGDKKGNISAVDTSTSHLQWKFKSGAQVSTITAAGKKILVTSYDNFVYLMSPIDGRISWKRRLAGRAAERPLVTEAFVAVTIVGEPGVSFLDARSGKLINRISLDEDDYVIGKSLFAHGGIIFSKQDGIYFYSSGTCETKQ